MKPKFIYFIFIVGLIAADCKTEIKTPEKEDSVENILLKNFRPVSLYKSPSSTGVEKAAFPVIDAHSHDYASSKAEIEQWIRNMDACGIEKTIVLTQASGSRFDSIYNLYSAYGERFDLWCGFDYRGYDKAGYGPEAVKELERCFKIGAKGVGEEGDKGLGLFFNPVQAWGMHFDDARMKPLFEKCAELNMPISIHVADPIWMYEKMDSTNDGLMNAETWRIDMTKPDIIGFDALVKTLENAVRDNPKTTFVACHFVNLNHDMEKLGEMFDKYPNFFADISARFAESSTIPRYMKAFYEKYQDRLLYGTDMGYDIPMYRTTFRVLETNDEHFYDPNISTYHWAFNGFGLSKEVLKKVYRDNALRIFADGK